MDGIASSPIKDWNDYFNKGLMAPNWPDARLLLVSARPVKLSRPPDLWPQGQSGLARRTGLQHNEHLL